jgi:hypothetical protein
VPSCKMGPAQHCCQRLSLVHIHVHSDLPHSTSPHADSPRSLLQLSLSYNELSSPLLEVDSFRCHRLSPPPVAYRRSATAAAADDLLQSTAVGARSDEQLSLPLNDEQLSLPLNDEQLSLPLAMVSRSGQPLLPLSVSRTMNSFRCHSDISRCGQPLLPLPTTTATGSGPHSSLSFDCSAQTRTEKGYLENPQQ